MPSDMLTIPAWWILVGLLMQGALLIFTVMVAYNKAIFWLGERLTHFETVLSVHAQQLLAGVNDIQQLTTRLEKTEQRHFDLAQHLQRLVGRVETWAGPDRRRED